MKLLFLGDVFGKAGRRAVKSLVPQLRKELGVDLVIANCENASGGIGVKPEQAKELFSAGVDLLTSGNHIYKHKEVYNYLDEEKRIVRPANYPPGVPGRGFTFAEANNSVIAVLNLVGRVFMEPYFDCPFRVAETLLEEIKKHTNLIIVDFHAEATSEKIALAYFLDGKVSAVIGTHTHVQTADERILKGGTAFISDAGMTGPTEGVIGMRTKEILQRFLTGLPQSYQASKQAPQLQGVVLEIDESTGKSLSISRIKRSVD